MEYEIIIGSFYCLEDLKEKNVKNVKIQNIVVCNRVSTLSSEKMNSLYTQPISGRDREISGALASLLDDNILRRAFLSIQDGF